MFHMMAENEEGADQQQRDAVGDRHRDQVARGREGHQRGKQQQPDSVGDHDPPGVRAVSASKLASGP
jgi:hypothetical protein